MTDENTQTHTERLKSQHFSELTCLQWNFRRLFRPLPPLTVWTLLCVCCRTACFSRLRWNDWTISHKWNKWFLSFTSGNTFLLLIKRISQSINYFGILVRDNNLCTLIHSMWNLLLIFLEHKMSILLAYQKLQLKWRLWPIIMSDYLLQQEGLEGSLSQNNKRQKHCLHKSDVRQAEMFKWIYVLKFYITLCFVLFTFIFFFGFDGCWKKGWKKITVEYVNIMFCKTIDS